MKFGVWTNTGTATESRQARGRGDPLIQPHRIARAGRRRFSFGRGRGARGAGECRSRSNSWFDPELAERPLAVVSAREDFWEALRSPISAEQIFELEPARCAEALDDDYLDEIVAAFAQVVNSKSHYTAGHRRTGGAVHRHDRRGDGHVAGPPSLAPAPPFSTTSAS